MSLEVVKSIFPDFNEKQFFIAGNFNSNADYIKLPISDFNLKNPQGFDVSGSFVWLPNNAVAKARTMMEFEVLGSSPDCSFLIFQAPSSGSQKFLMKGPGSRVLCLSGASLSFSARMVGRSSLIIGEHTSIVSAQIIMLNTDVMIGAGGLWSSEIVIQGSDQHGIIDLASGKVLNAGRKKINFGRHVWVGRHATINKNVSIGDGSIVGTGAIVTRDVSPASVAVGSPAKVVKTGVTWISGVETPNNKEKIEIERLRSLVYDKKSSHDVYEISLIESINSNTSIKIDQLKKEINMFSPANIIDIISFSGNEFGGTAKFIKAWVYKEKVAVFDFLIHGYSLAFDVIPSSVEAGCRVELISRKREGENFISSLGFEKISENRVLIADIRDKKELIKYIQDSIFNAISTACAKQEMTIGVLTLPLNSNIGGNLQAYALMEVMRNLGNNPILLNRRSPSASYVYDVEKDSDLPLISNSYAMSSSINRKFVEKYITPISRQFYFSSQMGKVVVDNQFDAVIVGSDQVWRPKYAQSILFDNFLSFLPKDNRAIKRISYAASFGAPNWEFDPIQTREAANLISRFDAVSVREDSAVQLCKENLGVEAQHVLDPTLLLTPEHYLKKFSLASFPSGGGRLLSYILDLSKDKAQVVQSIADKLSLRAFSTNGIPFSYPVNDVAEGDRSVEGWLGSIYNADYVITDSFHGTVFSILFNKPFIAYGNPNRGMARFTSLLKMFGLENRLVLKSADVNLEQMIKPIDWENVNNRLEALREKSIDFLKLSLSGELSLKKSSWSDYPVVAQPFERIKIQEVQNHPLNVLCSGCGACVSESDGALSMTLSADGFLIPKANSPHIPEKAIKVCPFNPKPEHDIKDEDALAKLFLTDAENSDVKIGHFKKTYAGYSQKFRPTSSSGGIATYVFDKLLEQGHVDYLYIVMSDGASGYKYQIFKKGDDILKISKTRYFPVSLDDFFTTVEQLDGKVAVSGIPCFLKAIRLKQKYYPSLKQKIPFLLGIFCGGLKSRLYTDFLVQSSGINEEYLHPEYRVKDINSSANDYSFSAKNVNLQTSTVKMQRLGDMWGTGLFKARACDFCTDVVAELADISLGDAWLPEYRQDGLGHSVVITRSVLAEQIISTGLESGDLVLDSLPVSRVVQSQAGGFGHRHGGTKFRAYIADNYYDLPLPVLREKHLNSGSILDALVQILRERTRSKSFLYWKENQNSTVVRKRLKSSLHALKIVTDARRVEDKNLDLLFEHLSVESHDFKKYTGELTRPQRVFLRWLNQTKNGRRVNFHIFKNALKEGAIVPFFKKSVPNKNMNLDSTASVGAFANEKTNTSNSVPVVKCFLPDFPDVQLWRISALDVYEKSNGVYFSKNKNKITIQNVDNPSWLKNIHIYFSGKDNEVVLSGVKNVFKLDVACINGSSVNVGRPETIRGAVVMASNKASVSIGDGCLISRDVLLYCSAAHSLYGKDGMLRNRKSLIVGNRVWIGQGARLLAGANVGEGSVVGSYSVLAGEIPNNCAAAGNPCRVTTTDIYWRA